MKPTMWTLTMVITLNQIQTAAPLQILLGIVNGRFCFPDLRGTTLTGRGVKTARFTLFAILRVETQSDI